MTSFEAGESMAGQSKKQIISRVLLGVVILLVAWQGVQFIKFSVDQIPAVWTWIGKPARWRSAAYTTSEIFADYVALANEIIPADAAVAAPDEDYAPWQFSHLTYLQYQMFPRDVSLCSNTGCLIEAASNGSYALIADLGYFFSDPNAEQFEDHVVNFNNKWGILTPEIQSEAAPTPLDSFSSIKQMGGRVAASGLWLLTVAIPGLILCTAVLPDWRWVSRFFLGLTVGLGVVSFIIYLCLLFTQVLSTPIIWIATGLWGLAAVPSGILLSKRTGQQILNFRELFRISIIDAAILAIGLVVAFISIGKSYWGTDGIILWANKGYGIAAFGLSKGISDWGTLAAHYPLQNPILISIFKVLFGDTVPESKILPAVFYISLPLAASELFRKKTSWKIYIWPILLWMLVPFIIRQGTIGYANLPFSFYLIAAVIIGVTTLAQDEISAQAGPKLFLSGMLFAIAAWNRPEGTALCLILLVLLLVWKRALRSVWRLYTPFLIYTAIWMLTKNIAYTAASASEGNVLDGILNVLRGNIIWSDAGFLSKTFFQKMLLLESWGLLVWALLAGLIIFLIRRRSNPQTNVLILSGILVTLAALTVIYLKTYNPAKCDVSCMVNTAMERLALPGVGLIWIGVSDYLLRLFKKSDLET